MYDNINEYFKSSYGITTSIFAVTKRFGREGVDDHNTQHKSWQTF
jgi:hypothetical protein